MHIDFALPVSHDLLAGWAEWQRKAEGSAVMDYGFHMAVTSWSARVAADMASLARRGVNSFKFFMAYKGGCTVCVLCVHCAYCVCSVLWHVLRLPLARAPAADALVFFVLTGAVFLAASSSPACLA